MLIKFNDFSWGTCGWSSFAFLICSFWEFVWQLMSLYITGRCLYFLIDYIRRLYRLNSFHDHLIIHFNFYSIYICALVVCLEFIQKNWLSSSYYFMLVNILSCLLALFYFIHSFKYPFNRETEAWKV